MAYGEAPDFSNVQRILSERRLSIGQFLIGPLDLVLLKTGIAKTLPVLWSWPAMSAYAVLNGLIIYWIGFELLSRFALGLGSLLNQSPADLTPLLWLQIFVVIMFIRQSFYRRRKLLKLVA